MNTVFTAGTTPLTYGHPDIALREFAGIWNALITHPQEGKEINIPRISLADLRENVQPNFQRGIGVRLFQIAIETPDIGQYTGFCSGFNIKSRPNKRVMISVIKQCVDGVQKHSDVNEVFERAHYFALNDGQFFEHSLFGNLCNGGQLPLWLKVAHRPLIPATSASFPGRPGCLSASFAVNPKHWQDLLNWFRSGTAVRPHLFEFRNEEEIPPTVSQATLYSECRRFAWNFFQETQVLYPLRLNGQIVFRSPDQSAVIPK